MRPLIARLLQRRDHLPWLIPALLLPIFVSLGGMALYRLGGDILGGTSLARAHLLPIALLAAVPIGPLAEELGWRGHALPRLRARFGPFTRSVVIWTLWAFLYTPLFWAPAGSSISGRPVTLGAVAFFVALLVGWSFVYT